MTVIMFGATCPLCGSGMESSHKGEPDFLDGWYCNECLEFWTDEELDQISRDMESENEESN